MKILFFKFDKNRTINENFDVFEGGGGRGSWEVRGISSISISINVGKYMNMLCSIFNQYRTMYEEFVFFEKRGWGIRGPIVIIFYLYYYW